MYLFGKTRASFFVYKFVKLMTFTASAEDFHSRLEYPVFIKCLNGLWTRTRHSYGPLQAGL